MGKKEKDLMSSKQQEEVESEEVRNGKGDDDDEAEANEDLSLRIIERAIMLKESNDKSDKDGVVKVEMVTSLKGDAKVTGLTDDKNKKKVKKVVKKVIKKVKKNVNKVETIEAGVDFASSRKDKGFETFCTGLFSAEETKQEERLETAKGATADIVGNVVQTSPVANQVLQKLLRGPRYFDPPDNGWGTCYNCGEEGHMTMNCTSARRKKPCFVCGSLEHNAKQCTKGRDCFICKKEGHRAKDCPEKNAGSQTLKFCLKCGENGHDMFSCRGNYCPDDLKEIQCYVCGEVGHLCCKHYPDTGPTEVSCYRCGFSGHTGLACTQSRGETTGSGSVGSCFKCGEEGHFARGCSNSRAVKRNNQSTTKQRSLNSKRDNMEATPSHDRGKGRKKRKAVNESLSSPSKSKKRHGWTTEDPGNYRHNNGKTVGRGAPATPYNNNSNYKSKQRHGLTTEDPRNYRHGNGIMVGGGAPATHYSNNGNIGWRSPATPYNNRAAAPYNNRAAGWGSPATPYNNGAAIWGSPTTPYHNGAAVRGPHATPYNYYDANNYGASGHASNSHSSRYPGMHNYSSSYSKGYHSASQFGNYGSGGTGRHYYWH